MAGLIGALVVPSSGATTVGAHSVSTLQQRARTIAIQVDQVRARLNILAEEYDQARGRAAVLRAKIAVGNRQLNAASASVTSDNVNLRRQAVDAYVNAGSASGLSVALSTNASALPLQQTYLAVVGASLNTAISSLQDSEHQLNIQKITLSAEELDAARTANELQQAQSTALGLEQGLSSTLSSVNGQLANAVAQQEAAQAAQAAANQAAAAQAATAIVQQAAGASDQPVASAGTPPPTSSGSSNAAVQAAESQLGTPYQWAGASPGGFDCSGLTMWSWAHAGVNLPHSAAAQYASIPHVSMSDLQPGDLIFYAAGGYISHVIMYVGGGRAIQAETYGIPVQYTSVWGGAVGAGRP